MDFKNLIGTVDFDDYKLQRNIIKRYLRDANLLLDNNGSIITLCEILEWIKTFCASLTMLEDKIVQEGYNMDEIAKALETSDNDADEKRRQIKVLKE